MIWKYRKIYIIIFDRNGVVGRWPHPCLARIAVYGCAACVPWSHSYSHRPESPPANVVSCAATSPYSTGPIWPPDCVSAMWSPRRSLAVTSVIRVTWCLGRRPNPMDLDRRCHCVTCVPSPGGSIGVHTSTSNLHKPVLLMTPLVSYEACLLWNHSDFNRLESNWFEGVLQV